MITWSSFNQGVTRALHAVSVPWEELIGRTDWYLIFVLSPILSLLHMHTHTHRDILRLQTYADSRENNKQLAMCVFVIAF